MVESVRSLPRLFVKCFLSSSKCSYTYADTLQSLWFTEYNDILVFRSSEADVPSLLRMTLAQCEKIMRRFGTSTALTTPDPTLVRETCLSPSPIPSTPSHHRQSRQRVLAGHATMVCRESARLSSKCNSRKHLSYSLARSICHTNKSTCL